MNDVITLVLDPNLYYSRLSFFESGREAINIKYDRARKQHNSYQNKFCTRSTLVSQLIPNPSEGKVRALFGTSKVTETNKITEIIRNIFSQRESLFLSNEFAVREVSSKRKINGTD